MEIGKPSSTEIVAPALEGELVSPSYGYVSGDKDAIEAFLGPLKKKSVHTERAYRKELGRFMAWVEYSRGTLAQGNVLSLVTKIDVQDYQAFLQSSQSLEKQAPGKNARNAHVRFWKAPQALAQTSVAHAMTLLGRFFKALCEYEVRPGVFFRSTNPFFGMAKDSEVTRKAPRGRGERHKVMDGHGGTVKERILPISDIALIFETIEALPRETARDKLHYHRARWLISLAYNSWLRLHEIAALQMGDFERDDIGWRIYIHQGKGRNIEEAEIIRVNDELIDELKIYRRSLGKFELPMLLEGDPAVMPVIRYDRNGEPERRITLPGGGVRIIEKVRVAGQMTERALYTIIKATFEQAALKAQDQVAANRLMSASPHWLRHAGITHALDRGIEPRLVQQQARHLDAAVTQRVYDHGNQLALANAMQEFGGLRGRT
jgi:integrase/recombinase XerD